MTAKIFHFHQHKHVEFIDLLRKKEEMRFDVRLEINQFPFTLTDVVIEGIKKDKIRYNYDSIYHSPNKDSNIDICPFCGKPFESSVCEKLTSEKDEIFSQNISRQLFFPIMSFYYNDTERTTLNKLVKKEVEDFKPLFYGMAEGIFIQCIFSYKGEVLLFQDVIDSRKNDVLPLIFYFNPEQKELNLYIEYLLPENLMPLTSVISKSMHKPNVEIFNTTDMELTRLYTEFLENNPQS